MVNNMDNSLKGLILAAGVIISCIVIGLGFYISREAKNTSNNGASQLSSMNAEYQDVNKTMYNGLEISGREVKDVIYKSASTTFGVIVKTGDALSVTYSSPDTKTPEFGIEGYVNPDAQFLGEVTKDDNNVINTVTFTQQK
mgnify:CR=1 FL=1